MYERDALAPVVVGEGRAADSTRLCSICRLMCVCVSDVRADRSRTQTSCAKNEVGGVGEGVGEATWGDGIAVVATLHDFFHR